MKIGEAEKIILPEWDQKIQFNGLSEPISHLLNHGYFQWKSLDEYLKTMVTFSLTPCVIK